MTRVAVAQYTLLLDTERLRVGRDEVIEALHRQRIGTGVHYRAVHLHPYYRQTFGYGPDDFPNARWISDRTRSLPPSPKLTGQDAEDVVLAVQRTLEHCTHTSVASPTSPQARRLKRGAA